MRLLCVDTATPTESVALLDDGQLLAERTVRRSRGHGPGVLDDVDGVLRDGGLTLADLDGLVCGLGPGSFTGLRIALATLKGLALATNLPLYGVRTTLALCAASPGAVLAVQDARRGEVYAEGFGLTNPICCAPERLHERLSGTPILMVGSGALRYRDQLLAQWPEVSIPTEPTLHVPRAALLAGAIDLEHPADLTTLEPIYIRPSDAEINYPNGFPTIDVFGR